MEYNRKIVVKIFVVIILLTTTTELRAQKFGIRAGLNLAHMLWKDNDEIYSEDYNFKSGFHVGAIAELPITEVFSFESGLLLSTKGFNITQGSNILDEEFKKVSTANILYLDIPLTGKASLDVGGTKIFCQMGPYLSMGLSGNGKAVFTEGGETSVDERDIVWGSDKESDLKRFDYGLTMGVGVEINSIQFVLTYNFGIANISANRDFGQTFTNRVIGISVGYLFSGK